MTMTMTMHEWFHEMFLLAKKVQAGEISESDLYAWAEEHKGIYDARANAQIEKKK